MYILSKIFILIYHTFQAAPKPINLLSTVICDMSKFFVIRKVVKKDLASEIAFQKPNANSLQAFRKPSPHLFPSNSCLFPASIISNAFMLYLGKSPQSKAGVKPLQQLLA